MVGKMAGVTGLEPAASGVTGRRSNQLSYTPLKALIFWSVCSMVFAVSNPKNTKNTHHIAKSYGLVVLTCCAAQLA